MGGSKGQERLDGGAATGVDLTDTQYFISTATFLSGFGISTNESGVRRAHKLNGSHSNQLGLALGSVPLDLPPSSP